jgi:hypothetical protein
VNPESLYEQLGECVCRHAERADDLRLAIADSKALYQPGSGLRLLERGVVAAWRTCGRPICSWRSAWEAIAGHDMSSSGASPWHADYDHDLPLVCDSQEIDLAATRFAEGLSRARLELLAIHSTAIFPAEFNALVERYGNKATVLSRCTLELVRRVLEPRSDGPAIVSCDKHGGRNYYHPLLQQIFPEFLVEVRRESRDVSTYRWGPRAARVEFQFHAQGERMLPAALASMVSKYLRELAMRAFNAYWIREIPGLHPTAGYPVDARRFKNAIHDRQMALGIPDAELWRSR